MAAADDDLLSMQEAGGQGDLRAGSDGFRPRPVSYMAEALFLAGTLAVLSSALSWILTDRISLGVDVPAPSLLLALGGALVALAAIWEGVSRARRCPPPAWRVKQELACMLMDAGLLPRDRRRWRDRGYRVRRPRYDRASGRLVVRFDLRNMLATEKRMAEAAEGSSFRYAQGVEVAPFYDKKKRKAGWVLTVQYKTDDEAYAAMFERVGK